MQLEELGKLKKIHLIGTRTHDLPDCNIVPQPTTLPRAPNTKTDLREIGWGGMDWIDLAQDRD
jgi:hypothetical protein